MTLCICADYTNISLGGNVAGLLTRLTVGSLYYLFYGSIRGQDVFGSDCTSSLWLLTFYAFVSDAELLFLFFILSYNKALHFFI